MSITRKEAGEYIERYFETYPGIKAFLDGEVEKAKTEGYVSTIVWQKTAGAGIKVFQFHAALLWGTSGHEFADTGNGSRYYQDCHDPCE